MEEPEMFSTEPEPEKVDPRLTRLTKLANQQAKQLSHMLSKRYKNFTNHELLVFLSELVVEMISIYYDIDEVLRVFCDTLTYSLDKAKNQL